MMLSKPGMPFSLKTILVAAFLPRLFLLIGTPFDDKDRSRAITGFNDERSHINFVRYLAEHAELPVQTHSVLDADAFERNEFEYYQAPLYYLLAAPGYALTEGAFPGMGPYAVRSLSLLLGLLTVAAAYWAGSALDRRMGLLCAGVMAFLPTSVYFTSLASNDALAWLCGTIWIGALLRSRSAGGWHGRIRFAFLIAVGLLSKSSLLTLVPLLGIKPWLAWRRTKDWKRLLPPIGIALMALALTLPYYLRNLDLYGSVLALETGAGERPGFLSELSWLRVYGFLSSMVITFWEPNGYLMTSQDPFLKAMMVSATAALALVMLLGWRKLWRPGGRWNPDHAILWAAAGLSFAGYLGYYVRYRQSESRLMFHALAALGMLVFLAWRALFRPRPAPRSAPVIARFPPEAPVIGPGPIPQSEQHHGREESRI